MVRVKICGMMTPENIAACAEAGVHALGFVVEYPAEVPWNLPVAVARELVKKVPPFVTSCMVAAGSPERVAALAEEVRPHVVQLHGDEGVEETARTAQLLEKWGIRTVKALRTDPQGNLRFEIPDPEEAAKALSRTGIHGLLVDAVAPGRPGGSGLAADSGVYRTVWRSTTLPVILAGGLRAGNLTERVPRDARPFAVDVLTGVEGAPGVKDIALIKDLMRAAAALR